MVEKRSTAPNNQDKAFCEDTSFQQNTPSKSQFFLSYEAIKRENQRLTLECKELRQQISQLEHQTLDRANQTHNEIKKIKSIVGGGLQAIDTLFSKRLIKLEEMQNDCTKQTLNDISLISKLKSDYRKFCSQIRATRESLGNHSLSPCKHLANDIVSLSKLIEYSKYCANYFFGLKQFSVRINMKTNGTQTNNFALVDLDLIAQQFLLMSEFITETHSIDFQPSIEISLNTGKDNLCNVFISCFNITPGAIPYDFANHTKKIFKRPFQSSHSTGMNSNLQELLRYSSIHSEKVNFTRNEDGKMKLEIRKTIPITSQKDHFHSTFERRKKYHPAEFLYVYNNEDDETLNEVYDFLLEYSNSTDCIPTADFSIDLISQTQWICISETVNDKTALSIINKTLQSPFERIKVIRVSSANNVIAVLNDRILYLDKTEFISQINELFMN